MMANDMTGKKIVVPHALSYLALVGIGFGVGIVLMSVGPVARLERSFDRMRSVALDWQSITKDFEAVAELWKNTAEKTAATLAITRDDFLVCNSMLPAEKRIK